MNRFSLIKYSASFVIALALGFGLTKMFNNLSAPNTGFTREEGISHLHKKVRSLCNADFVSVEETKGKTVFVDERREGKYSVVIDWDYSIRGKHELIWYDKKEYEKCIVEMSEAEQ